MTQPHWEVFQRPDPLLTPSPSPRQSQVQKDHCTNALKTRLYSRLLQQRREPERSSSKHNGTSVCTVTAWTVTQRTLARCRRRKGRLTGGQGNLRNQLSRILATTSVRGPRRGVSVRPRQRKAPKSLTEVGLEAPCHGGRCSSTRSAEAHGPVPHCGH